MPYIANPLEGIPLVNTFITDQVSLGAAAASDDTLIIYDISATSLKQLTIANLQASVLVSPTFTGTLTVGGATIVEADLETIDGVTAGTAVASKTIVLDSSTNITGIGTIGSGIITATGTSVFAGLDVNGAVDISGDLTLSAGADGALRFSAASSVKVLDNDGASLVFEEADNAYMTFVTTNGSEAIKFDKALDINAAIQSDSTITVGVDGTGYDVKFFGATSGAYMLWDENVDDLILAGAAQIIVPDGQLVLGSTAMTSTAAELNVLDGVTLGTAIASKGVTTDGSIDTTGQRNLTITGALTAVSLDISGDVDVDGTLEADAITVGDVALGTFIRDTVGTNMLSGNAETGIAVTYDTSNDNIDFAVATAQTTIESVYNAALKAGRDADNLIDFATTDNKIILRVNGVDEVELVENALSPVTNNGVAIGTSSLMWSDLFLADGGVLNFNSGDMTITHGSNILTVAGGTFATAALTTSTIVASAGITGTQVDILAQGDLRLQDTSGNQYVALQAAGTTTTHTLTFPAAVATTAGDVLSSSTGGVLSWTTPSAGVGLGLVIALGG